jgi:prephenate dehydrogenase
VRIAIVGFGLIGGSVARALRRLDVPPAAGPAFEIAAWGRSGAGPLAAMAEGVVDRAPTTLAATLEDAELVVLAAPPLACLELLDELAGPLRRSLAPGATLTDVASTKAAIVARADGHRLAFVGGHPMAGSERTGYPAASAALFDDRPWVVCPGAAAEAADLERVVRLAKACGARPVTLEPAVHDRAAAAISHIPLVVSTILVEAMTGGTAWPVAAGLAAGGWRDMSRLAAGDEAMSAGIAATNAGPIAAGLREVRAVLDRWIVELDRSDPDAEAMRAWFEAARERLETS